MNNSNVQKSQIVRVLSCDLKNMLTGEVHHFERVRYADEFLGRTRGYTSNCIRENQLATNERGDTFKIISTEKNKIEIIVEPRGIQLCWTCQNAVGGCSWSDGSFTPIEGWDAEPTNTYYSESIRGGCGYAIHGCPQFIHD